MPSKRAAKKVSEAGAKERDKKGRGDSRLNGNGATRARGSTPELVFHTGARLRPSRLNPESSEEREKRLAARKALTLRAFHMTYENRRRKAS